MAITPLGQVWLYKGVPFDINYIDTILFTSKTAQTSYFTAHTLAYQGSGLQYVRVTDDTIKVAKCMDEIQEANYMRMQNNSFEEYDVPYSTKNYYAFITKIEYVNDSTSLVHFQIDVLQSFMLDWEIPYMFVLREHSAVDTENTNFQPEPFEIGELIPTTIVKDEHLNDYSVCIAAGDDINSGSAEVGCSVYGGMLQGISIQNTGVDPTAFDNAITGFKAMIDLYVDANAQDSIISCFVMPTEFISGKNGTAGSLTNVEQYSPARPSDLDGYYPKNKKLLHYPYSFLAVDTGANAAAYRWEYFNNNAGISCGSTAKFKIACTYTPCPEASLTPYNYNGSSGAYNYVEQIKTGNFGQVAFTTDSYKAWIANNGNAWNLKLSRTTTNAAISGATGIVSTIASAVTGNIGGAVTSAVNTATSLINSSYDIAELNNQKAVAQIQPDHASGQQETDLDMIQNAKGFWFKNMVMRQDYAESADNYLSMYGYACNKLEKPTLSNRVYWDYIQALDADFTGQMPQEYSSKISEIFNRGVRFWHVTNDKYFKNYAVANDCQTIS